MRNYIKLNGNNSNNITGLLIQELPPITKPKIRTQIEEINGRDGDILTNLGYSAYNKEISIGLYGNYNVDDVIAYFNNNKTGEVIFSNEPDKYYNYEIFEQIDFDRLIRFRTATVKMHVQPFKYPLTETPYEVQLQAVTGSGTDITLNDTGIARLGINLSGDTSQYSTTGKNLLNATTNSVTNPANVTTTTTIGAISLTAGTTYYISYNIENASSTNTRNTPQLTIQNTSTTFYESISTNYNLTAGRKVWTFNCTTTGIYDLRYWCHTPNVAVKVDNFMISTSNDTTYEPYTNGASPNPSYPQEVQVVTGNQNISIQNKNLCLGVKEIAPTRVELNCSLNIQQTITLSVTLDDATSNSSIYCVLDGTNVGKVGTITGSANTRQTATIVFTNEVYAQIQSASSMFLQIYKSGNNFTTATEPQIENGSTLTSYVEHQEQNYEINLGTTELCKIGDYQDTIIGTPDNWKIHREIGKVVLNGSETGWALNQTSTNTYRFAIDNLLTDDEKVISFAISNFMNNNFQEYAGNDGIANIDSEGIAFRNNLKGFGVRILKTRVSDLTTFKTWLSNNNTIVYYVLATATDETITDETLIEELNNLYNNAVSYLDQTNITSNGSLPIVVSASALKKGTNEVVINNAGNIYAKPTIAIQGTGTVGLYIGAIQYLSIDMSTYNNITIDTDKMEAYNTSDSSQLRNRQVTGDYSKIKLQPGNNTMSFSGDLTSATITNWKRWL